MTPILTWTDFIPPKMIICSEKRVRETELTHDRELQQSLTKVGLGGNVAKTEVSSLCHSQKLCINMDYIILFAKEGQLILMGISLPKQSIILKKKTHITKFYITDI